MKLHFFGPASLPLRFADTGWRCSGCNLNEIILEVIALARSEVQGNRVSLETQFTDDVPLILGDRIQLQQVILNLIINAVEAMTEASDNPRDLLVGSEKDESQGVRVTVRDSGPGINPESLDHLFTAFFTTKPPGMGMGLAISRSIIEEHGGRPPGPRRARRVSLVVRLNG